MKTHKNEVHSSTSHIHTLSYAQSAQMKQIQKTHTFKIKLNAFKFRQNKCTSDTDHYCVAGLWQRGIVY